MAPISLYESQLKPNKNSYIEGSKYKHQKGTFWYDT